MMTSATAAVALLSACSDDYVTAAQAGDIAEDHAEAHAQAVAARVDDLEVKVADLERQIRGVRALGLENASNADSLRGAVNNNAHLANEKTLAAATKRGQCGSQLINHGGWIENRLTPCTPELLGWGK